MKDMIFNIYYINFPKVYEIKMMLGNIISLAKEIQQDGGESFDNNIKGKIGAKFLNLFGVSADTAMKNSSFNSQKILETFEIKTTKSVILDEVLRASKEIKSFKDINEGELVKLNGVTLELVNDAELRTIKLFNSGGLKGISIPGSNGLDINNLFNSMFKDYAYKMRGRICDSTDELMIKIPLTFESEFESSYSVDDLFIGKVSLIGLYKGTLKARSLKNTFEFFQELGLQNNNISPIDNEISESQYKSTNSFSTRKFDEDENQYHYIDLLAIVQDVKIPTIDK
ncbi:hypothetical protein BH10BAC5_BH10BAC5_09650 [soil metagenome]